MEWLIFAQAESARVDLARLARNARDFFPLSVDVLEELAAGPQTAAVRLDVEWSARAERASFRVTSRPASDDDRARARLAEERCRAGGLADLAARCRFVWELTAETPAADPLRLAFAALLASVALGPILPPDAAELYGVRGARERVELATGGRRLTR